MTTGDAVIQMMQQLRGIVAELNRLDEPNVAVHAQTALASLSTLSDDLAALEIDDIEFKPIKSDVELTAGSVRKGPLHA